MANKSRGWRQRADEWLRHPVIAGVVVGVAVIVLASAAEVAWSGPTDILREKVRVWQAVVAVGGLVLVLLIGLVLTGQALTIGPAQSPRTFSREDYPREIEHFGVKWPIYWLREGGLSVGQPMCPKDRTPLAMLMKLNEGEDNEQKIVAPMGNVWKSFDVTGMRFECSKCGAEYDLRSFGYRATAAMELVEDQAWGEYRTAKEKATAKNRR
jgi:hypothetical protein